MGQKSSEFSFLLFTVTSTYTPQPLNKRGLKLLNIVYLKSHKSQYYAQKPQGNCIFLISASVDTKSGQYPRETWKNMWSNRKVLTYIEYRAVSGVFRPLNTSPLPLHPASMSSLPSGGEGVGGGGSIFRNRPDIGLASYSIIPLREQQCGDWKPHRGADRRHHAPQAFMPRLADH